MSVFSAGAFDRHELVAFHEDVATGLRAIIAIHNTALGPGVGGCRMYPYSNEESALDDVLRLSRGMTYKSALAGLPLGGAKSVIIGNPRSHKSRELLLAMAGFIEGLNGRYVAAEDSGTTVADMRVMQEQTSYVSGVSNQQRFGGDPSPYTAYGVYCGIRAALKYREGHDSVRGLRFAVQGAGAVGRHLVERLLKQGADVYVADVDADNLARAEHLGAKVVSPDRILHMPAEVFVPCALGGVLDEAAVEQLSVEIVAGAANNQLSSPVQAEQLRQRDILYVPDFALNAGGIIDVYYQQTAEHHPGRALNENLKHIEAIADTVTEIFKRSDREQKSTHDVAEQMAEAIFQRGTPPAHARSA